MKKNEQNSLLKWYDENKRPLPWRKTTDPYSIWISETMLQQTTTTAVIPYYKKFIERFPHVKALADALLPDVFEYWAGLGYYSRARNLHNAAKMLSQMSHFPDNYQELIQLPGFGPYTARAVSSLAFKESVGVLDGNVIRVLCRKNNLALKWWKSAERQRLQDLADLAVQNVSSRNMNQALMELGATVCLPKNPQCSFCPWLKNCEARKHQTELNLPLKKAQRPKEIWIWHAQIVENSNFIQLVRNEYAPFLKNQWFLPGRVEQLQKRPQKYDFRHSITHHDIYVVVKKSKSRLEIGVGSSDRQWVKAREVKKYVPASLVQKALTIGS